MKVAILIPLSLWAFALIFGNYQIFSTTNTKMETFHSQPPFRIGAVSNHKNLALVLDANLATYWERTEIPHSGSDFFLEMKLTHFWDGKVFSPFPTKSIAWKACPGRTLPKFRAKLYLRESINVDKELRMPKDQLITEIKNDSNGLKELSSPISVVDNLKPETNYPHGISIYTLEVKLSEILSPNDCFSEIMIRE
jgi:hypothetical protein